jgi:hypothetical protein
MTTPTPSKSPLKASVAQENRHGVSPFKVNNPKLKHDKYFCHYTNAVYMGGMHCFKREGKGIIFLDNGACIVA